MQRHTQQYDDTQTNAKNEYTSKKSIAMQSDQQSQLTQAHKHTLLIEKP